MGPDHDPDHDPDHLGIVRFADVNAPGPFWAFPGVDRVITVVAGADADPQALAQFRMTALRYVPEPQPLGHETWESWLAALGVPKSEWTDGASISDPEGNEFDLR